ncbi:MAG: UDP-N-acetyl glucosamine 2-epimerase, partial [Candidatus Moranbacteria bacterium]|nr:UDP-N-acetyl glucosamine 2-epimerase [Candidatus Moranbacteria bacterium]
MNKKIGIILGTRPEIIKFSSIIRYCKKNKLKYFIIHTNQHYSENMDAIFFKELDLPKPKYNLGIGSGTHGDMTGRMMIGVEEVLLKERPYAILVQGDTNTVMAGALVASKLGIKVGHVEAGLRSYDRAMPEEINRVVTDHISDFLFCPTKKQADIAK